MIMSNETERTLHELKLPGMASCWSSLEETHQLDKLTLREGMQIMLQYERDTRGNNRIQRLIKNAGFRLRASMEELETDTARGIQACSAADLATGNYITGGMTVIITGPAGTGKSYFACALGDRACRNGRKVLYFTMNMLIENLKLAHPEGRETNFFRKLNAHDLLIIDDFGMVKLDGGYSMTLNRSSMTGTTGRHSSWPASFPLQTGMMCSKASSLRKPVWTESCIRQ